ncbi:MAG: YqeG family HAD IIIA-type phosphatase [Bacillota bacterium]|nr:YqeG family HAD IIIA-type phosphatase [Bacillota bacterium]
MSFTANFKPDLHVAAVTDIPLAELWQNGVRGLLFDVDNTIALWRSPELSAEVRRWFAELPALGFCACLLSNSDRARVEPLAAALNIPYIYRAKKPAAAGFKRAGDLLRLDKRQLAMVGDQLFTDIYGARRAGIYAILVDYIDPREFAGTRHISRRAERLVKRRW